MTQQDKDLLIKDICGRLPYGNIRFLKNDGFVTNTLKSKQIDIEWIEFWINKNALPILHPMSGLVKLNPKTGVPYIVELAKINDDGIAEVYEITENEDEEGIYYEVEYQSDIDKDVLCQLVVTSKSDFQFNAMFYNSNPAKYESCPTRNQSQLFDYLNRHMLDYRGLIEKGLAIDINTI